ncbi:hypothetical protein DFH28DRAFT_305539 [Melampsora americana]|nr:hypothetical protein DFH28DRAFT_305539 [Melampsora americana]
MKMKKVSFFEIFRIIVNRKKQKSKSKSTPSSSCTSLHPDQLHPQRSKKATLKKSRKSQIYTHQDSSNTAIQRSSLTLSQIKMRKTFDEVLTSQLTIKIYSAPNDRTKDFVRFYDFGQGIDYNSHLRTSFEDEEDDEEDEEEEEFQSVKSHQSLPLAAIETNLPNYKSHRWPNSNSALQPQDSSNLNLVKSLSVNPSNESIDLFFSPDEITTDLTSIIQNIVPSQQNRTSTASQESLQSDLYSALDFSVPFSGFSVKIFPSLTPYILFVMILNVRYTCISLCDIWTMGLCDKFSLKDNHTIHL